MNIIAKAKSAVALALLLAFVQPAFADLASDKATVEAAKVAGTVGEQADGYLGYVKGSADGATTAAVTRSMQRAPTSMPRLRRSPASPATPRARRPARS